MSICQKKHFFCRAASAHATFYIYSYIRTQCYHAITVRHWERPQRGQNWPTKRQAARACVLIISSLNVRVLISARAPAALHCLCPTAIHRLCRWWAAAQEGQPLQPTKVNSSGKWHLWLWVVSGEQLGERKRGAERMRQRTGVGGKRLGQALLLIY